MSELMKCWRVCVNQMSLWLVVWCLWQNVNKTNNPKWNHATKRNKTNLYTHYDITSRHVVQYDLPEFLNMLAWLSIRCCCGWWFDVCGMPTIEPPVENRQPTTGIHVASKNLELQSKTNKTNKKHVFVLFWLYGLCCLQYMSQLLTNCDCIRDMSQRWKHCRKTSLEKIIAKHWLATILYSWSVLITSAAAAATFKPSD